MTKNSRPAGQSGDGYFLSCLLKSLWQSPIKAMTKVPNSKISLTTAAAFSLNPVYILSHVALDPQRDMAHSQYDVVHAFSLFFPQNAHFLVEPRRVGPPTRHRHLPIRRGSRFSSLFASNYPLPCPATSCWTPNATSHTANTTWLSLFLPFCLKLPASYLSHVVLGSQRDIATSQYDVAPAFPPFLPQNPRFLVQPRRVGPPTRHRHLPIRRGSHFFSLFASKYSLPTRATSHWTSNVTWHTSNTTWRPLSTQKPPALYGWLPIFFI